MSAQVFRARMHHQIDAKFRRMLVDGCSKRGVDHAEQPMLFGQCRHLLEIDNAQSRIGRRLEIEKLRVRTDRPRVLLVLDGVDERGLYAHLWQPLREKFIHAAVDIALSNHMVAALHQRHDRGRDRSHARGERQRRFGAFQLGDRLLGNSVGGIAVTRVKVVAPAGAQLLIIVGDFESRGLIDRRGQRPVFLVQIRSAAHRLGFGVMSVSLHGFLAANRLNARVNLRKQSSEPRTVYNSSS